MSYPTMDNTRWERQQPGYLMPPQNQGAMVRAPIPVPVVVKEEQEKPPPEKWQQVGPADRLAQVDHRARSPPVLLRLPRDY